MSSVLQLPSLESQAWQLRHQGDRAANALMDRHYSRKRPGSGIVGAGGRKLVLVTPQEDALWVTWWPYLERAMDHLDAWRCTVFRNEGERLASELIVEAMALTELRWGEPPADGWVTWVDKTKIRSSNPGFCFLKAGWRKDEGWEHPRLVRLRA